MYNDFESALRNCELLENCEFVFDFKCDGEKFWLCSANNNPGVTGSCTWKKNSGTTYYFLKYV